VAAFGDDKKLTLTMPICNLNEIKNLIAPRKGLLGLDPGRTVIGVAISDPGLKVGSPLMSLRRQKFSDDAQVLLRLIHERNIGGLVVGLPKHMDGSEGASAQSARAFVRNLIQHVSMPLLPIAFWDERLSSMAVERFMIDADMSRQRRQAVIDKMAAAYILQGALDYLQNL
jgi:putative Holliday junction resolvase